MNLLFQEDIQNGMKFVVYAVRIFPARFVFDTMRAQVDAHELIVYYPVGVELSFPLTTLLAEHIYLVLRLKSPR